MPSSIDASRLSIVQAGACSGRGCKNQFRPRLQAFLVSVMRLFSTESTISSHMQVQYVQVASATVRGPAGAGIGGWELVVGGWWLGIFLASCRRFASSNPIRHYIMRGAERLGRRRLQEWVARRFAKLAGYNACTHRRFWTARIRRWTQAKLP